MSRKAQLSGCLLLVTAAAAPAWAAAGADAPVRAAGPVQLAAAESGAQRDSYLERMQAEMTQWQAKVNGYYAQAKEQGREVTGQAQRRLRETWDRVESRWRTLEAAGGEQWAQAKDAFEDALQALQQRWQETVSGR